jgi:DNA-binding NarL/FixJ family response regulator
MALTTQASGGEANTPGLSSAFSKAVVEQDPSRLQDAHRPRLTPRAERALIALARAGGVIEAAAALGIAPGSVKAYLWIARQELGVFSNVEAFKALGWLIVPNMTEVSP